jgi:glycosyltransferase involved in cell wall biosynthesis
LQSLVHYAAERVVVPSPSAAQAALEWADVPADKIIVIPNAVECDSVTGILPMPSNKENQGQDVGGTIGFIGRLDPIKRVPDLVEAIAFLDKGYTLQVFGEGEDRPQIENAIKRFQLQERAILHGAIARPQEALSLMDVLVLPSAAEGFGLVLIEAMAAGVPVVATDVPGIRDVVKDGVTGLLVPVASPVQLAGAIQRLCEDSGLRNRLTEIAAAHVRERYSWDVVLPQYNNLLG